MKSSISYNTSFEIETMLQKYQFQTSNLNFSHLFMNSDDGRLNRSVYSSYVIKSTDPAYLVHNIIGVPDAHKVAVMERMPLTLRIDTGSPRPLFIHVLLRHIRLPRQKLLLQTLQR